MRIAQAILPLCWTIALAAPVLATQAEPSSPPADSPMAVTSDTAAYCATLERLAGTASNPAADVRRLIAEGQEMCDRGEIRGGIASLRRALVVERHHATGQDPR